LLWDEKGLSITNLDADQVMGTVEYDRDSVYLGWQDGRINLADIASQKVDKNGILIWGEPASLAGKSEDILQYPEIQL